MSLARLVPAAAFLAAGAFAAALLSSASSAQGYSDRQFEEVMRGYLEISRGESLAGSERLLRVGTALEDADILRDATFAAVAARDLDKARRAGEAWYQAGGGLDALRLVTRIHITRRGLASASGLLSKIAEETGAEGVFRTLSDLDDGDIAEAFRRSHPLHLRDGEYHAYLAMLMYRSGRLREAPAILERGLAAEPGSLELHLVRLRVAELLRDSPASLEAAKDLARAADTDVAAALMVYGRWAEHDSQQAVTLPGPGDFDDPLNLDGLALLNAGQFLLRHGDPRSALETLEGVPGNSPGWVDAVAVKVLALRELGEQESILGLLEEKIEGAALEFVPDLAGIYAEELNDGDGPLRAYEYLDALGRGGDDHSVIYAKSLYAERAGLLDEAEVALREYIRQRPDDANGYNALSYMYAVHDYRLEEALELVERALAIEPKSAAFIDTHGWVLFRMGDLAGARARIEEALRLMGDEPHAEVMAHYGEILWQMGQREHAVDVWRKAHRVDSEDPYLVETLERYGQRFDGH